MSDDEKLMELVEAVRDRWTECKAARAAHRAAQVAATLAEMNRSDAEKANDAAASSLLNWIGQRERAAPAEIPS